MKWQRNTLAAALWCGLLVIASGCGEHKKIKECRALIGVINQSVERIQKRASVAPDGGAAVAELRALAGDMDEIVNKAAKVELSLAELTKLRERYGAMVGEVAEAARKLAAAVDKVDVEKMTKAQNRMERAVKREDPLVEEINKYCQSP